MTLINLDRYTESGYVTPESVNPPSREDYTARSVDDFYVEPGYSAENYTVATLSGQRDLSISSSLSSTGTVIPSIRISTSIVAGISALGGKLQTGTISNQITATISSTPTKIHSTATATLTHAGDDVQWQYADTWAEPKQETWRKRVVVRASIIVRSAVDTMPVVFNTTTGGSSVRTGTVTADIATAVAVNFGRRRPAASTVDVQSNLNSSGISAKTATATMNIAAALNSVGQARQIGSATLNAAVTVVSASGRIRPFSNINAGNFSLTVSAARTRRVTNSNAITATLSSVGIRKTPFRATLNTVTNITVAASNTRTGTTTANIQAATSTLGGKLIGIANEILPINTGFSSRGLIIQVDPYRTIQVLPELRTRTAIQETRVIGVKNQTLINTVRSESRGIRVLPETRRYLEDRGTHIPATKERI